MVQHTEEFERDGIRYAIEMEPYEDRYFGLWYCKACDEYGFGEIDKYIHMAALSARMRVFGHHNAKHPAPKTYRCAMYRNRTAKPRF